MKPLPATLVIVSLLAGCAAPVVAARKAINEAVARMRLTQSLAHRMAAQGDAGTRERRTSATRSGPRTTRERLL
jgi:hypothetical protein